MTQFDFDEIIERRDTNSGKWLSHPPDVLPMFVADMDFKSPPAVARALQAFAARGVFGYPLIGADHLSQSPGLREVVIERMRRRYGWEVAPEAVLFVPGVYTGFNLAAAAFSAPGGEVLVQTPAYPPILSAPAEAGLARRDAPLVQDANGRYSVDLDDFAARVGPNTKLFLLCNPHNPVGRVFRQAELEQMAEVCLRHGVPICSDEIHSEIIYPGQRHIPIASLAPEIAQNTITLISPSKTFNLAGLQCAIAIIPNPELREAYLAPRHGLVPWVTAMGLLAAETAYREGGEWLAELLAYLEVNRGAVARFVAEKLPGVRLSPPEATYLAWLDCRATGLADPCGVFLEQGRVACGSGSSFGPGGDGFVRSDVRLPAADAAGGAGADAGGAGGRERGVSLGAAELVINLPAAAAPV